LTSSVGAVQDKVADPLVGAGVPGVAVTVMLNAGSEAVAFPSTAVITIFRVAPVSVAFGLPESWPVEALKLAQAGAFCTVKVRAPPSESVAVGVKL
jgi:hypothetical protein